jgi:hypothetical protein
LPAIQLPASDSDMAGRIVWNQLHGPNGPAIRVCPADFEFLDFIPKAVQLPEERPANDTLVLRKIQAASCNFGRRHFFLQKKARELGMHLSWHMPASVNPQEA